MRAVKVGSNLHPHCEMPLNPALQTLLKQFCEKDDHFKYIKPNLGGGSAVGHPSLVVTGDLCRRTE